MKADPATPSSLSPHPSSFNIHTFFEKFALFADAPDAVAKMRELVLEWAASGKLCHDDSVEWKEGVLGDVVELISGQHLLAHEHNAEGRGIPYLTGPSDFGEKSPMPTRWTEQPKVTAEPGDILITVKGSGVGKTNVLVDQPTAISRQLMAVRVTGADPEFVHVMLKRAAEHFQNAKTGIAIPGIGRREVLGLKVVLPPLAEQKRIVAKVDELMALCDRLEAQQQERETWHAALTRASLARFADAPTPANLQFLFHSSYTTTPADLRKSILTLAIQGKLVAQDPDDEPAAKTFPKLSSSAIDSTDDEFPAHWVRVPLGKTGEWLGGGTPSKARPEFWAGDVPWVTPKDMKVLHISDAQDHISNAGVAGSSVKMIPSGSLIMVVRGMILARAFPVAATTREVTINQDMKALLPYEPETKDYLLMALRAFEADVLAMIEHSSHGTCKLKTEFLQNFVIPIPPLAEQRRIVAKMEQLMALVDQLEAQLAASRSTAANLLEALVAELTAQA